MTGKKVSPWYQRVVSAALQSARYDIEYQHDDLTNYTL